MIEAQPSYAHIFLAPLVIPWLSRFTLGLGQHFESLFQKRYRTAGKTFRALHQDCESTDIIEKAIPT